LELESDTRNCQESESDDGTSDSTTLVVVKSRYGFTIVREMKCTSQQCCDKKWTAK